MEMQRFEILTNLPSRLSCIMQEWLTLKIVILLDSAFCCRSHRGRFTDLVRSDEYIISEQVIITHQSQIMNMLQRFGEKLRSIRLFGWLLPTQTKLVTEHCHNLTQVRFHGYNAFSLKMWNILGQGIVLLDLFDVIMDNARLLQIPQLCPYLRSLGLASVNLEDHQLIGIATGCPYIVHLDISYNRPLTDAGILNTVVNLTALRGLNIEGCVNLSDAGLVHIYTHCARTLHTLQMDCSEENTADVALLAPVFSVAVISTLLEHCTQLRTLHLGKREPSTTPSIKIPPAAIKHITTLIMGRFVCIDDVPTRRACYTQLQTLATDFFYRCSSLVNLIRRYPNVRNVYQKTGYLNQEVLTSAMECFQELTAILSEVRPGIVATRVENWEDYNEHDVMNMNV